MDQLRLSSAVSLSLALALTAPAVSLADTVVAAKDQPKDAKTAPAKDAPKDAKDPKKEGASVAPRVEMTPISQTQIDEAMQLLREIDPELFNKIGELRSKNPERVAAVLFQHLPRLAPLAVLKKSDPELFKLKIEDMKLDRETHDAVKQLRAAAKDEVKSKEMREKIQEMVTRQFYVRQEIREHELASLEKKVGELREQIEARKDAREELIKDRIKQLTSKEETAEW